MDQTGGSLRTRSRIAAHVISDYLTDPEPQAIDEVPWSAEAISPAWLTEVLCRDVPGAHVEDVMVTGGHDGSTVRRRLIVRYNKVGHTAGLPEELFAKTTPTLLTRLSAGHAARAEQAVLSTVRPELDIEAPELVHSSIDEMTRRSVQLFVDLEATKNARFCTRETVIGLPQAEQIVDTLAELHGKMYGSQRFSADLAWLSTYEEIFRGFDRIGIKAGHDLAMVAAAHLIPQSVFERRELIWPIAIEALTMHQKEPRTLLHSDVHLGNWYVTGDGRMGLADWQLVCTGHWARDFAYAVSTTLAIEDRRRWEEDLLGRYLDKMASTSPLATKFEEARQQCARQLPAALLTWTPTLCHPPTMPEMQPEEMSLTMIKRMSAAINDHDVLTRWAP